MARGEHLVVRRGGYSHHGVDVGDGSVIHVIKTGAVPGRALVGHVTMDEFAAGGVVEVRAYGSRRDPDAAVELAMAKLGADDYHIVFRNCEHFATWCVAGEHSSAQVESASSTAGVLGAGAIVPSLSVGIVSSAGQAAALSGPNLMSGLRTIGGSPRGGIAVLSGSAGLLALGAMCVALRDKPTLPDEERRARTIGRYGAAGGAAVGVGIAVHALSTLGVPGTSAAGITSGLAALGGTVGGGMTRGVAVTALLPVLLAAVLGYVLYQTTRRTSPANAS